MEEYLVKVKSIGKVTHDVYSIRTERPEGYEFVPGQATEVSINKKGWEKEKRPFTFTSTPKNSDLEFTIKSYPAHKGVTEQIARLQPGDELLLGDVWGAISYQGKGVFIAGGAGITPFLSIFRDLHSRNELAGNKLLFANKTRADIIYADELNKMLSENLVNILSDEKIDGFATGFITEDFLRQQMGQHDGKIYLCGPPPMMEAIQASLNRIGVGANALVMEI